MTDRRERRPALVAVRAIKRLLPRAVKEWLLDLILVDVRERQRRAAAAAARRKQKQSRSRYAWARREREGEKPRIRVAVAGAGRYAQFHLAALAAYDNVEVVGLLTTGSDRGRETAERFQIEHHVADLDTFAALDAECFVLVVPPQAMVETATACLRTGRPVLLEKPAGVASGDTAALASVAASAGTWGMIGMNRRFYSVVEHGLAALADLGPIRAAMLEVPQPITADRLSGRLTEFDYDHYYVRNSIHGVDLLRFVLGTPAAVHSLAWKNADYGNRAASFGALLEYPRGVLASVTDAWDTPSVWRLKVVAEQGWIEFEPLERGYVADARGGKREIPVDTVDRTFRPGIWAQDLHFVEAVRAGRPPLHPASTLADGVESMRLAEAILASSIRP